MEDMRLFGGPEMTVTLQNDHLPSSTDVLNSLWIPNFSPPSFHGDSVSCSATSMADFEDVRERPTKRPFFPSLGREETDDDAVAGGAEQSPEKKRRLNAEQVRFLEKTFEIENKLEPERKSEIAKELGLQPRQVAIWFQNRRARCKTKRLEKDYDSLKEDYDKLKVDYDCLVQEKERLKNQVHLLTEKLKSTDHSNCESTTNLINEAPPQKDVPDSESSNPNLAKVGDLMLKQENASSTKSDVFDSESPHCTNPSSFFEPADSSNVFAPERSPDFSHDNELTGRILPLPCFPKLEYECYNDPPLSCSNWNWPIERQPSWSWPF